MVDDFTAGSFTDSTGFELDLRLHQPTGYLRRPGAGTRYPLVVTLHGGGEVADTWTLMNALENAGAKVTRGEWGNDLPEAEFEARSRALLRQARRTGSHALFASYPAGATPVNPHGAWAQTYENDVVIDWRFDQSR